MLIQYILLVNLRISNAIKYSAWNILRFTFDLVFIFIVFFFLNKIEKRVQTSEPIDKVCMCCLLLQLKMRIVFFLFI